MDDFCSTSAFFFLVSAGQSPLGYFSVGTGDFFSCQHSNITVAVSLCFFLSQFRRIVTAAVSLHYLVNPERLLPQHLSFFLFDKNKA